MEIPFEILKNNYNITPGRIYGGEIFAKDGSPHKAVVFYVSKITQSVYTFCITSKEDTIKHFSIVDGKNSIVELPVDLVKELYGDEDRSWIYCGSSNLRKIGVDDFLQSLSERKITFYKELDQLLFDELVMATRASKTYSQDEFKEIGL